MPESSFFFAKISFSLRKVLDQMTKNNYVKRIDVGVYWYKGVSS